MAVTATVPIVRNDRTAIQGVAATPAAQRSVAHLPVNTIQVPLQRRKVDMHFLGI